MLSFSAKSRAQDISAAESTHFDLIIVGGGITGAGVIRDAAMRGLKVLLLEKYDFASGTSSKSSKLIHGGLRYLKQFDFSMTRESCVERNLLVEVNPHLVEPIPFLFPVYKSDKEGPLILRLGMFVYEALAGFRNHRFYRMLNTKACLEHCPDLNSKELVGASYYYDAAVDDARLVIESIKGGVRAGGYAFNQIDVEGLIKTNGMVQGVTVTDRLTGKEHRFRGEVVLNATGSWVDSIRTMDGTKGPSVLRPTKGVHIIIPRDRIQQDCTLAFAAVQDRRLMFCIPWGDVTLIGTTDTDYEGDKDTITATTEDVDYILKATNHAFPTANLNYDDVISTFAGLRPLVGNPNADDPGAVSREHEIFEDPSGLISVAGGKLTTYRLMAKELVNRIVKHLPAERKTMLRDCSTETPICGESIDVDREVAHLVEVEGLHKKTAIHLVRTYGPAAEQVLFIADTIKDGRALFSKSHPYLRGEIAFTARFEAANTVTDVLTRRLRAALWNADQGLTLAEPVSHILRNELGFSEAERKKQVKDYRRTIAIQHRPVPKPSNVKSKGSKAEKNTHDQGNIAVGG